MDPYSLIRREYPEYAEYLVYWERDRVLSEYFALKEWALDQLKRRNPVIDKPSEWLEEWLWQLTCVECASEVYGEHYAECNVNDEYHVEVIDD